MATLLDAAGRDVVMIETVGVGQDEVEIARLAHVTVVVLVPGTGDDVQAHQSRHHGDRRRLRDQQSRSAGRRRTGTRDSRNAKPGARRTQPPIIRTIATDGTGVHGVTGGHRFGSACGLDAGHIHHKEVIR